MQSAIENGRLVRDRKAISLKTPLSSVTLVDMDEQALNDLASVQDYIKDELNCLEVKTDNDEDKYIDYKCEPDNKEMGAALKKQYDKNLKAAISALTSAQLRQYLKEGYIMIGDIKIEDGWLKVQKVFKEEYASSQDFGCATDMQTCVLLNIQMDENLKQMGMAREITNRIQKLRKSSGISIDDQIEVFYSAPEKGTLNDVLTNHSDKIRDLIKMPFFKVNVMQPNQPVIGTTSFENDGEVVDITICKSSVHLGQGVDGVSAESLLKLLNSLDQAELKSQLDAGNGVLKANVDGNEVELTHGTHFYLNGRLRDIAK